MKKALIAGAASVALAAMPVVGVFAVDNTAITDNFSLTIAPTCALSRAATNTDATLSGVTAGESVTAAATYTKSDAVANQKYTMGTSTLKVICNNQTGYKLTGTFSPLTNSLKASDGSDITIPYSAAAVEVGTAGWTAYTSSNYYTSAASGNILSSNTVSAATGDTKAVTYDVATASNQAAGTYTGTASYNLAANAAYTSGS